ncbi:MAG: hypothetical protein ABI621_10185 [Chloroflexota bacterium]
MLKNRLFTILMIIVLVLVVGLTAREAFATADVVSKANAADEILLSKCAILPSQLSLHTEYNSQRGMWVTYTGQGPSGVDGGLIDLLSAYPTCSR